ncbi:HNH endonuclease [Nocardia asteroides]|uniref:HNH endonuclease n=1 Tax=Nocardia asteroides TaxID=1824 RepID=UPI0033D91CBA
MSVWACKSVGDDREWHSNDGYADLHGVQYVYTNTVGNSRRVKAGDTVVVHDRQVVHGASVVDSIVVEPNVTVQIKRCQVCKKASVERRAVLRPEFRCSKCKSEFPVPLIVDELRTVYTARIAQNWQDIDGALTTAELVTALGNGDRQSSIRPLKPEVVDKLFASIRLPSPTSPAPILAASTALELGSGTIPGGVSYRETPVRKNQDKFRRRLLQRDGIRCAVTGAAPARVLEAAHLRGYAKHRTHELSEGLLLRRDIHALFDDYLLAIHPTELKVVVAPTLAGYPAYQALHGAPVDAPTVSTDALRERYEKFLARWTS